MKPITKITKYWSVQKILDDVPGSVDCMIEYGLDCFACGADKSETLEEGTQAHGLSSEDLNNLIDEINSTWEKHRLQSLKKPEESDFQVQKIQETNKTYYKIASLMFTQKAHQAILDLQPDDKPFLKITLQAGGCSGYSYIYDYKREASPDDYQFQVSNKLTLLINPFSYDKLAKSVVDFQSGLQGSGLVFHNPNSKQNCHCGVSVGF